MTTLRGILVEPHHTTIREVQVDPGHRGIAKAINSTTGIARVSMAPPIEGHGVDVWVDDEGLLHHQERQAYWTVIGSRMLFAGCAVWLGLDGWGETVDLPSGFTVPMLHPHIMFLGGVQGAEQMIRGNLIDRPESAIVTFGETGELKKEVLWTWAGAGAAS